VSRDPRIAAVGRVLPPHWYDQETLLAALSATGPEAPQPGAAGGAAPRREGEGTSSRPAARAYPALEGFGRSNGAWIAAAAELGEAAVKLALDKAGLAPSDVGHFVFVTVTGLSVPSLEVKIANRLGMRHELRRTPIFGLGCAAGRRHGRAADTLRAFPATSR